MSLESKAKTLLELVKETPMPHGWEQFRFIPLEEVQKLEAENKDLNDCVDVLQTKIYQANKILDEIAEKCDLKTVENFQYFERLRGVLK